MYRAVAGLQCAFFKAADRRPRALVAFSLPIKSDKVPTGPDWLHEIKYDGYRMMLIRESDRVRLISRGGRDWARYFPRIVAAALKLCQEQFTIDGEARELSPDGLRRAVYVQSTMAGLNNV